MRSMRQGRFWMLSGLAFVALAWIAWPRGGDLTAGKAALEPQP